MRKSLQLRTLESTFAGTLMFLLSFIYSIVLVPVFLKYWGEEKYGMWISILAFVYLMRTIDLGHQNYIGNEFNRLYHQNKNQAIELMGSSFRIAFLLGFIELLFFLGAVGLGIYLSLVGLENELGHNHVRNGILAFLIIWWLVGSVGGVLVRLILPLGKYAYAIYLGLIFKVGEILILLTSALFDLNIFHICLTLALFQFFYSLFIYRAIYRLIPDILSKWRAGSWRKGFANLWRSLVLTLNGFLDQLNINGTILLVSSFLTLAMVPVFTTIRTLANTVTQLTNLITNPMQPELIRYHALGDGRKIRQVIQTNWFVSGMIVNIPFVLILPFISWLYELWTNSQLEFNFFLYYYLTLGVAILNYGRAIHSYLTGINHLPAISVISVTRTLVIFGVATPLITTIGLSAIGLGVLCAEIFSSVLIPLRYIVRELAKMDDELPLYSMLIGGLPVMVLFGFYLMNFYAQINTYVLILLALVLYAGIFYWQWTRLDAEVRERIWSLAKIRF